MQQNSVHALYHRIIGAITRLHARFQGINVERSTILSPYIRLERSHNSSIILGGNCAIERGCEITTRAEGAMIRIDPGTHLRNSVLLESRGKLVVKGETILHQRVHVACVENVTIGRFVTVGTGAVISDNYRVFEDEAESQDLMYSPIYIGDRVNIGANAVISAGTTIGDDAVIGAGAVVVGDVPANAVMVGAPARILRYRHVSNVS